MNQSKKQHIGQKYEEVVSAFKALDEKNGLTLDKSCDLFYKSVEYGREQTKNVEKLLRVKRINKSLEQEIEVLKQMVGALSQQKDNETVVLLKAKLQKIQEERSVEAAEDEKKKAKKPQAVYTHEKKFKHKHDAKKQKKPFVRQTFGNVFNVAPKVEAPIGHKVEAPIVPKVEAPAVSHEEKIRAFTAIPRNQRPSWHELSIADSEESNDTHAAERKRDHEKVLQILKALK